MSDDEKKLTIWFWIIGIVCLIWNLMGVMAFVMQLTMSPETLAALPEAERTMYEATPVWVLIAFAVAVFSGTLGCIFLLMKKTLATIIFKISLVGILIQMYYNFFVSKAMDIYGPGGMIMPIMVLIVAIFLIWYSASAKTKGWIN